MAETVNGTIVSEDGTKDITLNNIATEATLLKLANTAKDISKTLALAKSSGINTDSIQNTADSLNDVDENAKNLNTDLEDLDQSTKKAKLGINSLATGVVDLTGKLISGSSSLSESIVSIAGMTRELSPGLSTLINFFGKSTAFFENSLKSFQIMSDAGVRFGGSLMKIRENAAEVGLTLDQFSTFIKQHGDALSMLGNTADEGANNFVKISKQMKESGITRQIMDMGFSFEELNSITADFLQISGGRKRGELETTDAINNNITSIKDYATNLADLSALTGKSREKLTQEIKELSLDPAWQSFLSSEQNSKIKAELTNSLTSMMIMGPDVVKNFQAMMLGIPAWNQKAAASFAFFPEVSGYMARVKANLEEMQALPENAPGRKTLQDKNTELISEATFSMIERANAWKNNIAQLHLMVEAGGPAADQARQILELQRFASVKHINSLEDLIKVQNEAKRVASITNDTEVDNLNQSAIAFKNLQTHILASISSFGHLTYVLPFIANHLGVASAGLVAVAIGAKLLFKYLQDTAVAGSSTSKVVDFFSGWGHTQGKALWVKIVPGFGGGAGGGGVGGAGGGAGGGGKASNLAAIAGRLGTAALVTDLAGNVLTATGHERAGAAANVVGSALGTAALVSTIGAALAIPTGGMSLPIAALIGGGLGLMSNWDTLLPGGEDKTEENTEKKLSSDHAIKILTEIKDINVKQLNVSADILNAIINPPKGTQNLPAETPRWSTPQPRNPYYGANAR